MPVPRRPSDRDRSRAVELLRSLLVGRSSSCDLAIASDAVSRLHVALERVDGAWWAADLGSTNGTWLDDEPVRRGARLQLADTLVHVA